MEFYGKLFVGDGVADRADKIKQKLLKNEFMPFVHVITLPLTDDGMLEIYPAYILRQELYRNMTVKVVGLAADHSEACRVVQQIVEECMKSTGKVDLKGYLKF